MGATEPRIWLVTGAWYASDFFVPENIAQDRPYDALAEVAWGVRTLSGYGLITFALAGTAIAFGRGVNLRQWLTRTYGGRRCRKMKGFALIRERNGVVHVAELHWFEAWRWQGTMEDQELTVIRR